MWIVRELNGLLRRWMKIPPSEIYLQSSAIAFGILIETVHNCIALTALAQLRLPCQTCAPSLAESLVGSSHKITKNPNPDCDFEFG
jgi:hypothetical protein